LNDGSNPFHGLVTKATETVNREPFSVEEMKAILTACADDDFIRPVIVTGMCTAMRRGDCCLLKWEDVDHKEGFITVKTAKTGETVDIPMFPMLRDELAKARAKGDKSKFCFPLAAEMYRNNPDGITWRVKQVIGRAFETMALGEGKALATVSSDEVRARGLAYIDGLESKAKAQRMRQVFTAYMDDQNINEVMASTGASRGTVSGHLNEIEGAIGCAVVRGNRVGPKTDALQAERENGQRKASVRDFHSFRVTWITLALAAGVPLELVQRVTGHRTVEVVMKHYFRPGREDFRQTIMKAMPKMLSDGGAQRSVKEEILTVLNGMSVRTWKSGVEQLRTLALRLPS
jgi:integrase